MLTLKNDELFEILEDGSLQALFPWACDFEYDAEIPKGRLYRIAVQRENTREMFYTDSLDNLPTDGKVSVCRCTACKDINGRLIYEKDFVKTNEIGWCGFAFIEDEDDDFEIKHPVCIRGSGGFSYLPYGLEWLASPVFGEYEENRRNVNKQYISKAEEDFIKAENIDFA